MRSNDLFNQRYDNFQLTAMLVFVMLNSKKYLLSFYFPLSYTGEGNLVK